MAYVVSDYKCKLNRVSRTSLSSGQRQGTGRAEIFRFLIGLLQHFLSTVCLCNPCTEVAKETHCILLLKAETYHLD